MFLSEARTRLQIGYIGLDCVLQAKFERACTPTDDGGRVLYMAPELMRNEPYTRATDIWALGCTSFLLCALKLPFVARSLVELALKVIEEQPKWQCLEQSGFSIEMQDLVQSLLQKDAAERPTSASLINTEIFAMASGEVQPSDDDWSLLPNISQLISCTPLQKCLQSLEHQAVADSTICTQPSNIGNRKPCLAWTVDASPSSHLVKCVGDIYHAPCAEFPHMQ